MYTYIVERGKNMSANILFGNRLKKVRSKMGLSQEELAYLCNMQASHIGQLERCQKSPTLETLEKIAAGLNTTVSDLTNYSSNIPISDDVVLNKINSCLNRLNDKQKIQVLNIIKTFLDE